MDRFFEQNLFFITNTMNTDQQEYLPIKKFLLKKQISEKLFNSHLHPFQHDQKGGSPQHQRKIIFPQIYVPQDNQDQKHQISPRYQIPREKMDYIKLPEIDEKFFIKSSIQQELYSNAKGQHSSRKTSTENHEIADNNQFNQPHHQNNKKVEFQQDVLVYDYINQTYKKSSIDGSQKPLFRRQKTKNLSDDLRFYHDNVKFIGKSQYFEINTNERNIQKHFIIDTLQIENNSQKIKE
ncbi:unnamed protein product (macronuclear) [Paramecium tetraurelia]|uniref:Uncharacterized protein n=1 Tax=Paramecium tetraurelia TaxID=5888 RepID=A0BTH6_PARTE|nr:uncharacterized protein GSPATT00032075001 [Paramecium tetraurelia]CAK61843.1 unnamed protein product [Paramecium tetraurelia]|eukprot:XP_001429241.1 hypothetical protein (macronuclear) [Paramecium tetraurelia strain d4-2]